jgi:glycosyltransferase involved in cell wall biosynthesis
VVRIALLMPVLDEAECLPVVLPAWMRACAAVGAARVVVCDNGSTDGSPAIASALGAEVVHASRRGYGSALQAGLAHLVRAGGDPPDIVLIVDADGASDPVDLPALLAPIEQGIGDLVVGDRTRSAAPGALTLAQRVGNAVATRVIALRTGVRTRDLGPLRAVRYPALVALGMVDPTWGWNVEMHMKSTRADIRIVEVPVRYAPRIAGRSKISGSWRGAARAGARMLEACWRYG